MFSLHQSSELIYDYFFIKSLHRSSNYIGQAYNQPIPSILSLIAN